jgi:hypothetical protein
LALRALDQRPHDSTFIFAALVSLVEGKQTPADLIDGLMRLPVLDE